MAMKQWVRRLQPLRFVFVFCLTLIFFLVLLVVSHVTHALTLLVDSYNFLCNLIALFGSFVTYKFGNAPSERSSESSSVDEIKSLASLTQQNKICSTTPDQGAERRLRNTFGWARVDILVMLFVCVFLASLYFSLVVESFQTLIHISHQHEMHHPIPVLCLGITSIFLNIISYLLIGGYTFHQGSFQNAANSSTDISLKKRCNVNTNIQNIAVPKPKRQGIQAVCRDLAGGVIVVICALLVYWTDKETAKYIDPVMSIVSVCLLVALNFPFMKESCFILLQTIPDHINIESLCSQLLTAFPVIINVHDLHIWQLTVDKTYSTVHIIFHDPKDYVRITNDVTSFFHSKGITNVTIQPEFFKDLNSKELVSKRELNRCLVPCVGPECLERHCCTTDQSLESIVVEPQSQKKEKKKHCHKPEAKQCSSKTNGSDSSAPEKKTETVNQHIVKSETLPDTKENEVISNNLVSDKAEQQLSENTSDSGLSICENGAK